MAYFLRLFGCGCFACTNGPDGFISNNDLFHIFCGNTCQTAFDLNAYPFDRNACFTLFQCFTAAHDRHNACFQRFFHFFIYHFVCFAEILTAFRMTQHHIAYAHFFQHRCGYFACECAVIFEVHIFCTNANACALQFFQNGIQIHERYTEYHFCFIRSNLILHQLTEFCRFLRSFIHFPVACNNHFSHVTLPSLSAAKAFSAASSISRITSRPSMPDSTVIRGIAFLSV